MRSARSASRVLDEGVWWWPPVWGKEAPRWPSLMAIVDRAEREVVAEFGVPLLCIRCLHMEGGAERLTELPLEFRGWREVPADR